MDLSTGLLAVAVITGLYMAWNIGANDVANAMGTSVGSGALSLKGALIVAAIFEFSGAILVGGTVTSTISKGIVHIDVFHGQAMVLAAGMTCCLLAAAIWLHIATYMGWPVSTTHSIVGAVVGFGLVAGGMDAINWPKVGAVVASWIISPLCGALIGFLSLTFVRRRILGADNPLAAVGRVGPVLVFPIFMALSMSMIFKGLKPLKLDLSLGTATLVGVAAGALAMVISVPIFCRVARRGEELQGHAALVRTENVFKVLQIITACYVAFAHGSNDVANAVGPLAATFSAIRNGISAQVEVPMVILLVGAAGIVIGLATYGYKVMATIGKEITELTPSSGCTAEFAAATTILIGSKLGLPISTTHTLVGSVIGVGFARSIGSINTQVLRGIFASWFITVPFTAALAAGFVLVALPLMGY